MEYLLVGWWLLAFGTLAVIAYPLCVRLFHRFPGHGVGFAPILALSVLTVVGYWTGHVTYGRHTLWIALIALLALTAAVGLDRDALRDRELRLASGRVAPSRAEFLAPAMVFLLAFLLLVWIRSADPAVSALGGEKFLDYGLLRTMLRAETLPPYDVWFAGETVNYYYGGHLAAALLTFLTATPPAYAYNLALAGFYATLVVTAFELARAIAAGNARRRGASEEVAVDHGLWAGLGAAFFVGVASNLVTAGRVLVAALPDSVAIWIAERYTEGTRVSPEDLTAGLDGFHYWTASRVIPGTINEFPFFAFLNGDLHAHMMGAPFTLFGAALAYAYWETPEADLRRRRLLVFGALPILGGMQVVIHTWDFPTVFGLLWLALAFAPASPLTLLPRGDSVREALHDGLGDGLFADEVRRTGGALVVAGAAGGLAFLLGASFILGASSGQEPTLLDTADRSDLGPLIAVHGAFLLAFLAYLGGRLIGGGQEGGSGVGGALVLAGGVAAVAVAGLLAGFPAVAIVVPLLALGWIALRLDRTVGFETALIVGGAGLVGIVELVFLQELAGPGRLNTVFKVYFQVWVLWAVAMGVVLAELWARGLRGVTVRSRDRSAEVARTGDGQLQPGRLRRRLPSGQTTARVLVVFLVLATVPYVGLALNQHFSINDADTLHATAFADEQYPEEAAAIRWLDDEATHHDTLLEAPGASHSPEGLAANPGEPGMYTWRANPASSLTGIPTVAGWAHQVGYRGVDPYYDRVADVDRAYAGTDAERLAMLREYDVDYVWVGPTERERYGTVEFEQFDGVELVYETSEVRVYRVDQDALG